MKNGSDIDVACRLCQSNRVEIPEIVSEVERWKKKVRLTVCEESSIERLTKGCSKSSLSRRGKQSATWLKDGSNAIS